MYYVMMNRYATETSDGFANTWYCVSVKSKIEREQILLDRINAARELEKEEYKLTKDSWPYEMIEKKIKRY